MSLATRLRKLRIKSGKSLQDLADEADTSKAHVWDLETGRAKNPSADLLVKLSKALKVSVADLMGENPAAEDQDPQIVAMYRDLQDLTPEDREAIQRMMDHLRNRNRDT